MEEMNMIRVEDFANYRTCKTCNNVKHVDNMVKSKIKKGEGYRMVIRNKCKECEKISRKPINRRQYLKRKENE